MQKNATVGLKIYRIISGNTIMHTKWCFQMDFRYTGSYNYGSYSNQHPHPMQSQYPSLPHDTAISGPLHYSAYHRSSSQVSWVY